MPTNLPDVWCGVAFNADPNDPNATPTWSDLSTRTLAIQSAKRGRQYELDQNQTGRTLVYWRNQDEYLNPVNVSSPYAPNVVPYRRVQFMAMHPAGGAGNLLNGDAGYDPTFEAYTVGALPWWVTQIGVTGVHVDNASPFAGSNDLLVPLAAGSTTQGVSLTVWCIPGRTYTASVYARLSTTNTVRISVGATTGSSLSTSGTYTRLSVTWTATDIMHQVVVQTSGTVTAGNLRLDNVQVEPGSTASAFTTSGPLIRPVWGGYVERFPAQWEPDSAGYEGAVLAPCVGPLAALAGQKMTTEYRNSLAAKAPDYYWPLSEPSGSVEFAETSGKSGPPLSTMNGKYGAGTVTAGTSANIVGDPNGTGVTIDNGNGNTNAVNVPTTILQYGALQAATVGITAAAAGAQSWSCTVAVWLTHSVAVNGNLFLMTFGDTSRGNAPVEVAGVVGQGLVFGSGFVAAVPPIADTYADGKPHLFVVSQTMNSTGATQTVWIDGTQVATKTSTGDYRPEIPQFLKPTVGGVINDNTVECGVPATFAHLAYWNRLLSSSEIADLWNAGKGYSGETSGARASRYLALGWTGSRTVDTGMSTLGAGTVAADQSLLDALQRVTTSENGNLYEGPDGSLTFASRSRRYLATTSTYTFGYGSGEYPYERDVTFDFDPTLVYNDVSVQRTGGITAHVEDAASQKRYFPRSLPEGARVTDTASDNETTDYANYLVNQHKQPRLRVRQVTFNPAANPALWPMVLNLDIGTRVTVKRRPKAANGGSGITMSGDFFVENIEHRGVDFKSGAWLVTLLLSPVDYTSVWILGDSTYGVLDSTTVLAF